MSYQAHPKTKPVGVPQPQAYQQTRHSSAPRHQQQYRGQHPQARDNRYNISQPPRHPSPISGQPQVPSPSASPSAVPPQPPPTGLGTGAPHDMNKQGAPNRPALAPSPVQQGTILQGQQVLLNPAQIMYQQPNMARHQQAAMYVPLQPGQRGNPRMPMSNMTQTQQGGQPQTSYQQLTMSAPPFIPSSHHNAQQQQPAQFVMPPMMMPNTPMYAPRQQMQQVQYQHAPYLQQPNTPPFYSSSPPVSASTGAFFPQNPQTLVATQPPQLRSQGPTILQQQQQSTQQQQQQRLPPRERTIIRIVDPTSNQDITDALMREVGGTSSTGTTPTHSGRSSASSTPPASGPPPSTQQNPQLNDKARAIQASFAAQVALAAADTSVKAQVNQQTNNSQRQQPPPTQPPPPTQQAVPQIVHTPQAVRPPAPIQGTVVAGPEPRPNIPGVQPSVIIDNTGGAPVPITIASEVQKQPPLPIRPMETTIAPTQPVVMSHKAPIPAPVPAPAVPKPGASDTKQSSEAESNSAASESSKDEPEVEETKTSKSEEQEAPVKSADETPAESDKSTEKTNSKPKEEAQASEEVTSAVKEEPATTEKLPAEELPKTEKTELPVETAKEEKEPETLPQEKVVEKTSSTKEVAPQKKDAPSEAKQAPAAKENKKKNQKKRLQDLDKKETKTDDLDAYKDKDTSESAPPAPVPSEKEKKPEPKEDVKPAIEKPKEEQQKAPVPAQDPAPAPAPEKAPVKEEPKTELSSTKPEETKPDVESEELSKEKKDIPKIEVAVVDSVDKKERDKVEAENAKNKESMDNEDESNKPGPKDNKIQLKYTYREDQWSPVNPEGKKQYGRDFLLQFQPECKDKPDGLPHIPDIVLDKADIRPISGVADPRLATQRGGGGGRAGGGVDFMPDYMRSPRGSGQAPPQFPQMGPGGRRSSREPKKVIARDSKSQEVNLKKAENAWKPGVSKEKEKKKQTGTDEEQKTEELIRSFKSILNKLTPQNFQTLMSRTLQLPIDNEERLTAIIDLVFEKAISESAFSKAYANMCRVLSQIKVPASNASGIVQFRTVLINRCQRAFEAEKTEEAHMSEMRKEIDAMPEGSTARQKQEEELFILHVKSKGKVLGNMRFIGELFKLRMLTENIMHDCIFKLLRAKDDESLECMSQLMNTVGKDLDHERAKNRMDQYFTQIGKIISNKKISARIRFMLQDVQDLRKCNWIPRRDDNAPKTIAQIHQEAKQEETQKRMESQIAIHASKSREKPRSGGRPGPPQPDSDWHTVSATNKGRPQIDPSKLINLGRNRPDNDNVQLGPGGRPGAFGSWGRGSSGGTTAKMQSPSAEVDLRPAAGNNRYAILSGQGGGRPGMGPPTRDSKGRPTGTMPARRSREMEDDRRGNRQDSQNRERRDLLDEVSRTVGGARSMDRRPSKERGSRDGGSRGSRDGGSRGSRDGGSRGSRDGGSRGSRDGGSRDRGSRERGGSRDRGSREQATPSPTMGKVGKAAAPEMSDEEFESKGRATLDEYLNIRDMKEACECISELSSPERMHLFVRLSIEHVLEMDAKSRLATGSLFHKLIKENLLSVQQYLQGLNEVLEFADDMAIDIPLIWEYLGELMGSMIQDKRQSIDYLGKALEPVKPSGKAGLLLAEILRTAEKNIGAEDLNDLWQSTGLTWDQFVPSDENVLDFVKSKKLEYTLRKSKADPIALMMKELGFMLAQGKCDNDHIFDWIKKNTDPELTKQKDFIRALVTVVCQSTIEGESIRCDPELLKFRAKCLLRYIDGDVDRELQALFAVQALNHKLVNPPGFLRIIFDVLYDEDVISEETFYAWQNSKDPAEQNGKGVALKSVTSFFAWLGEAEEETPS